MQGVDEERVERVLTARRRADTYRLLADVFNGEPTAEMLDSLRRPEVVNAFEALGVTFVAELAAAEADAIERGPDAEARQAREVQRAFHRQHVCRWVPSFCDKVIEIARFGFYRDFAQMAKTLCDVEAVAFGAAEAERQGWADEGGRES